MLFLALLVTSALLIREAKKPAGVQGYGLARFTISLPPGQELAVNNTQAVVLSPDGRHLAYVAAEGVPHLYTRRLDQFESVAIPDSEGATFPFFSPNGEWIAFFNQGKLKKAPSSGGVPIVICEVATFFGGTWTPQDVIVAGVGTYGLATVPASGGTLQKINLNTKDNFYPQGPIWLGGGGWIAFTDYLAVRRSVLLVKLSTGEVKTILKDAQTASYVDGNLVYYQGGALWAVPFDPNEGVIRGRATKVESGINEENYISQASTSENGVLAYAPGPAGNFARNLYLVDRKGQEQKIDVPPQDYVDPAVSPDGKQIVCMLRGVNGQQLAVLDRTSGLFTTLVSGGLNAAPVWMPDGKTVVFDGVDSQQRAIYQIAADGSGAPRVFKTTTLSSHVTSVAAGTPRCR